MFKLDAYIHDYLVKRKYGATSKTFQDEVEVSTDLNVVDAPAGFLYEWWSVFWDIFIARYMVQVPGAVVSCKEAVDAIDNGINQYNVDLPPRYVNNTSLSSRVGRLNLDWVDPDQSSERENEAFQRAMMLARGEFMEVNIRERTVAFLISQGAAPGALTDHSPKQLQSELQLQLQSVMGTKVW